MQPGKVNKNFALILQTLSNHLIPGEPVSSCKVQVHSQMSYQELKEMKLLF